MADQGSSDVASIDQTPRSPELDFFSPQFDPTRALSTAGLLPPDPAAFPLDNVAKCRSILPPEMPESLAHVERKEASEVSLHKWPPLWFTLHAGIMTFDWHGEWEE